VFKKAVAQRPGDWQTYRAAATYFAGVQQFDEAEKYSRKVIEIAPENSSGYMALGALLLKLGHQKEAEQMLLKAVDLNPTATGYANIAVVYMDQHRYADAVTVMEKAAALAEKTQPGEFRIWGNLGDAYWLAKAPPEKARAAWTRAADITRAQAQATTPADPELLSYLAKFETKAGEPAPALEHVQEAVKEGAAVATVHYQAALAYALLGRVDSSLEEIAAALRLKYPVDEIQRAPELENVRGDRRYKSLFESPAVSH
jgi:serine/threonine-protein kinase